MRPAEIWKLNYEKLKKQLSEKDSQLVKKEEEITGLKKTLTSDKADLVNEIEKLEGKLVDKTGEKEKLEKEKVHYMEKIKKLEGRVEEFKEHLGNYIKMMEERANDFGELIKYDDGLSHIDKCEEQKGNLRTEIEKTENFILEDDKRKLDELFAKSEESSDITELDKIISELEEFKKVIADDEIRKVIWGDSEKKSLSNLMKNKQELIKKQEPQQVQVHPLSHQS